MTDGAGEPISKSARNTWTTHINMDVSTRSGGGGLVIEQIAPPCYCAVLCGGQQGPSWGGDVADCAALLLCRVLCGRQQGLSSCERADCAALLLCRIILCGRRQQGAVVLVGGARARCVCLWPVAESGVGISATRSMGRVERNGVSDLCPWGVRVASCYLAFFVSRVNPRGQG